MICGDRVSARLRLIALINELPLDANIYLTVRGLTREAFDLLPGADEARYGGDWSKDLEAGGVTVGLWTSEPPPNVVGFPPRPGELRVIEGGRRDDDFEWGHRLQ